MSESDRDPTLQTAAPGMLVPGALSPQRRPGPWPCGAAVSAVAPIDKNAGSVQRLVVVVGGSDAPTIGSALGAAAPRARAGGRGSLWTDDRPLSNVEIARQPVYEAARAARERSRPLPTQRPLQIDDPPTRPGFITALDDAYLMPREDGYAVFSRTSGRDLCAVRPEVAERALRRQGKVVRLGTWSGTLRGRADEWTLWWARGVPWASTSDVAGGEDVLPLIERWQAEHARAQARGQRWEPLPPGVVAPADPPLSRPRRRRARPRLLGGLRALFRTP
jgi:hypothetical protein